MTIRHRITEGIEIECSGKSSGRENMQKDAAMIERLQREVASGKPEKKLVRLYGWNPYAISLGYHQDESLFDVEKAKNDGIDVVRRPTGGRAVFHAEEVTYAVAEVATGSDSQHYAAIHHTLAIALKRLGVETSFNPSNVKLQERFDKAEAASCFTARARFELEIDGKKLVGSAQRKYQESGRVFLLQHGSLLLTPAHCEIVSYLNCDTLTKQRIKASLTQSTISLSQCNGIVSDFHSVTACIADAFFENHP